MDIEYSIPCGIIVNELVINSMKHAFAGSGGGKILVSLRKQGSQTILGAQDDGRGLPDGENQPGKGYGLRLVEILTEQIGGTMKIVSGPGLAISVTFPGR
jgi:two-component sensor histidine kinase